MYEYAIIKHTNQSKQYLTGLFRGPSYQSEFDNNVLLLNTREGAMKVIKDYDLGPYCEVISRQAPLEALITIHKSKNRPEEMRVVRYAGNYLVQSHSEKREKWVTQKTYTDYSFACADCIAWYDEN